MLRQLPKLKASIELDKSQIGSISTFPLTFSPNPGGQQQFFDSIGLPHSHSQPPDDGLRFIYLRGGIGAGKTMCGAAFAISRIIYDPEARGLITANTYGQLETSTLPGLIEFCDRHSIEISPKRSTVEETAKAIAFRRLCTITINLGDRKYTGSILILSAENFTGRSQKSRESGRGLQVRWVWADEYAYADRSAFQTINGRLGRGEGWLPGMGVITSSINKNSPYNWAYETFDDPNRSADKIQMFRSIVVKTSENATLDPVYYASVAAGLTEEHRKIELESEYVAVTEGRLISTFRRSIHALYGAEASVLTPDPRYSLHLAIDFNRSPATATIWQIVEDEVRGLREWFLLESDTFALGDEIATYIRSLKIADTTYIYGDASGAQKTANSRKTNWQIIYDSLSKQGIYFQSIVPKANPDIHDSVNGLKLKFGKDEIFVNGDTMPELVKDLESVRWDLKKDGQIDKSDPMRTHLLDGLRYLIWQRYPYKSLDRAKDPARERGRSQRQQKIPGIVL
jgi:Terminase large subunit, T4likevirus-type, N-terminal